jgi:hypothetical protein
VSRLEPESNFPLVKALFAFRPSESRTANSASATQKLQPSS